MFKPKGDNFEVEVPITVAEALAGAEVEVPTLHGTKKLRVAPGTKHGTVQRLRGEGAPVLVRFRPRRPALSLRDRHAVDADRRAEGRRRAALEGDERQPARADPAGGGSALDGVPPHHRITARVDHDRGVFMISVAAELAEMHPQTLRMYETRGLIEPQALARRARASTRRRTSSACGGSRR